MPPSPSDTSPSQSSSSLATKQESHRVYLQKFAPHSPTSSSSSNQKITATSAAIRLTGMARCIDVTTLLRKKFGLPALATPEKKKKKGGSSMRLDRINQRLQQVRSEPHPQHPQPEEEEEVNGDALVLVGTLYTLPKNYIQFEHEYNADDDDDNKKKEISSPFPSQKDIQTSASAVTIKARGGGNKKTSGTTLSSASLASSSGWASSSDNILGKYSSSSGIGLDLSSSGGGTTTSSSKHVNFTSSSQKEENPLDTTTSPRFLHPTTTPTAYYEIQSEPFNLIQSLKPNEYPLQKKEEMMIYLNQLLRNAEMEMGVGYLRRKKVRHPVIRWFFQPSGNGGGSGGSSLMRSIPSFVDVDGYCTTLEDSDVEEEDGEGSGDDIGRCRDGDLGKEVMSGGVGVGSVNSGEKDKDIPEWKKKKHSHSKNGILKHHHRHHLQSERHLLSILSRQETAVDNHCVSGYLLKRSNRDPCVWRRVHCVLTDDKLWYVSRMKTFGKNGDSGGENVAAVEPLPILPNSIETRRQQQQEYDKARGSKKASRIGKHSVIRLSRSLIIESNNGSTQSNNTFERDVQNLSRAPYAFEICTPSGKTHAFRAKSRAVQLRWIQVLSDRIVQCHENNFMELAELIIGEENCARWGRVDGLSVAPIVNGMSTSSFCSSSDDEEEEKRCNKIRVKRKEDGMNIWSIPPPPLTKAGKYNPKAIEKSLLPQIMRFGMEVCEYKELCRHIHYLFPKQRENQMVVVVANVHTNDRRRRGNRQIVTRAVGSGSSGGGGEEKVEFSGDELVIVKAAWDAVKYIYTKSQEISKFLNIHQQQQKDNDEKNNRSPCADARSTTSDNASESKENKEEKEEEEEEKIQEHEAREEIATQDQIIETLQEQIFSKMEEYQNKYSTKSKKMDRPISSTSNEKKEKDSQRSSGGSSNKSSASSGITESRSSTTTTTTTTTKNTTAGGGKEIPSPPPMDLFDELLSEFQACATSAKGLQQRRKRILKKEAEMDDVPTTTGVDNVVISAGAVV